MGTGHTGHGLRATGYGCTTEDGARARGHGTRACAPAALIMSSIQATRLRKGMLIKLGDDLFRVLDLKHFTPGNKRGFVQSRLRNIRTGTLSDHKFRSEDDVARATLDEHEMQYLYHDADAFHFMDT